MYSPDGFASLACAIRDQCFFLGYQQPFIDLMHLLNHNIYAFFALQAIIWFALIIVIYLISKELGLKHLLITPLILLYAGSFFVDNFVGSLENDSIGIIFILLTILFLTKFHNKNTKLLKVNVYNLLIAIAFLGYSLAFWMWLGHMINVPWLIAPIVEMMFWTHWLSWMILFPLVIMALVQAIKYRKKLTAIIIIYILFFPKLFIFIVPIVLKFIDGVLEKMFLEENKKKWITILVFALILGQFVRVGINTNESWNRIITDEECVTVNDEYFLRATKDLNYTYNQLKEDGVELCRQNKSG